MIESIFDTLHQEARAAFVRGDLDRADRAWTEAWSRSVAAERQDLADRAYCFRCSVWVERDTFDDQIPQLKKILLRSLEPKTRSMAAYYTAVAYDLDGERDRAQDYARRAVELAVATDDRIHSGATANLLGNLALLGSHFDEAEVAYERAIEAFVGDTTPQRLMAAQAHDNLGYVYLCTDRVDAGVHECESARNTMDELGAEHYLHQPLQDLCYGYILLDRLEEARNAGERGLILARVNDDALVAKNLLYLLGEACVRAGDRFRARRYIDELTSHYPDLPHTDDFVEVLLGMDLTRVVNLRG